MSFAAGFPYTLNYQGMLTNKTGQPVNEPQNITFNLYTTPIGSELPFWTEPLANVPVSNGQLSVTLGTVTILDPAKFSGDTYLGIKVGTQAEMLPRQKMTSVPYAFNAVNAVSAVSALNGVPKGGVIMWTGAVDQVPVGWALCDGSNGAPDLQDRFIVGVGNRFGSGKVRTVTGGAEEYTLSVDQMPVHSHLIKLNTSNSPVTSNVNADPARASVGGGWSGLPQYTEDRGGVIPYKNLPPYYALAFIMKL